MKLIIVGTGQFAEIAHEYFTEQFKVLNHGSYSDHPDYNEVVAFTVENEFRNKKELCGLPIIPFEDLEKFYPPETHCIFVAIIYGQLNRTRERLVKDCIKKGYKITGYTNFDIFKANSASISTHNTFIFEGNVIQSNAQIGNNVIMWSSNHAGHDSIVEDNVFISSHVIISGNCKIGRNCFIGVNATIGDGVTIGEYSWISPGAIVTKNVPPHSLVKSVKSEVVPLNEEALLRRLKS